MVFTLLSIYTHTQTHAYRIDFPFLKKYMHDTEWNWTWLALIGVKQGPHCLCWETQKPQLQATRGSDGLEHSVQELLAGVTTARSPWIEETCTWESVVKES